MTFPGITRKSCAKYCPLRRVDKGAVSKILSDDVPVGIKRAQHKLLQMSCMAGYRGSNQKPTAQSEWFYRQLRSYVQIYSPKCPFKIGESEHLSFIDREAAVFAKRDFQMGESIQFLSGVCVPLTKEEELQLEISGKDFSILQSSSNQPAAMFLGPARFVNHDCKANSEIVRATPSRARIVALKNIKEKDEITVFYGKDYFGDNNHECLCRTCTTRVAKL
jgi:histone-lysine N-methyltransferase SUV420H